LLPGRFRPVNFRSTGGVRALAFRSPANFDGSNSL
jgi:hypothetical protein